MIIEAVLWMGFALNFAYMYIAHPCHSYIESLPESKGLGVHQSVNDRDNSMFGLFVHTYCSQLCQHVYRVNLLEIPLLQHIDNCHLENLSGMTSVLWQQ